MTLPRPDARTPISLWDASATETENADTFAGSDAVDVAIVGGGFTGLSTAYHAALAGLSAHVLEARQIGFGGSGRNVGLVNAGIWLPPKDVRAALGDTYGPRFLKTFGDAPAYVFDLIEKHQIHCEATRSGTLHAAHSPAGMRDLEGRFREWKAMGEPVELLDKAQTHARTGTNRFHGALLDHRAGTVNPMGYCRGLARIARAAGARISTGVRVTALSRQGEGWLVTTDHGTISARHVVLGTNAYTDDLWPGLRKIYTMIHFFQLATKPLGERGRHILPERQGLWDTGRIMFSLRRDAYDRLIVGSMGKVIGSAEKGLSCLWARRQLGRLFPELGAVTFEEAWHGQIDMTPDHLPRIYRLDHNLYSAIGYNGRGITTGTIFGRAIADMLAGGDPAGLPLPMTAMAAAPNAGLRARFYDTAFAANQIMKSIRT